MLKLLLILFVTFTVHLSQSQMLFQEPSPTMEHLESMEPILNPLVIRNRVMKMDLAQLFQSTPDHPPVILNLFEDIELRVRFKSSRSLKEGGHFFVGELEEGGSMTLLIDKNGIVRGEVHSVYGVYTFQSDKIDQDYLIIREVDVSHIPRGKDTREINPEDIILEDIQSTDYLRKSTQSMSEQTDTTIDVLVIYTEGAKNHAGGRAQIEATITAEVLKTNQVLDWSGLQNKEIRLVGMEEVNYTQNRTDMEVDLQKLKYKADDLNTEDPGGVLDEVHTWRDRYAADFVHLFVSDPARTAGTIVYGLAYIYTNETHEAVKSKCTSQGEECIERNKKSTWANSAFSVSAINGGPVLYTFTHELGHSMGIFHDRYIESHAETDPPLSNLRFPFKNYGFGYVYQVLDSPIPVCWHTIMAYSKQCTDNSYRNPLLFPIFSNPDKRHPRGGNAGVEGEDKTTAPNGPVNAKKAISETWNFLANLKSSASTISCDENPSRTTRSVICNKVQGQEFSTITELDLSDSSIPDVTRSDFTGLTNLTKLNLNDNSIGILRSNVFELMTNLKKLTLNNNDITTVEDSAFTGTQLEKLDLSFNEIEHLSPGSLSGISELKQLWLNNNRILHLPDGMLSNLTNLEYLWLENNGIKSLQSESFSGLSQLKTLSLENNEIVSCPNGVFDDLSNLRYLWLNNNNLTEFPPGIFSLLSKLRYLNLSGNDLSNPLPQSVCCFLRNMGRNLMFDGNLDSICPSGTVVLYMVGGSSEKALYTIDKDSGSATRVGTGTVNNFGVGEEQPKGLAIIGNTLYMVGSTNNALYTVDKMTGVAERVAEDTENFGISLTNPGGLTAIGDTLYMVGGSSEKALYTLNNEGRATRVEAVNNFGLASNIIVRPRGLTAIGETLYMVSAGIPKALYRVDKEGRATRIGNAHNFGVDETQPTGLTAIGNDLYMITSSSFYSLDKETGEAEKIGDTISGAGGLTSFDPNQSACAEPTCDCSQNSDATKRGGNCDVDNNGDADYDTCTATPTCDCSQNPDATKRGGNCNVDNGEAEYSTCTFTTTCYCSQNPDKTKRAGNCVNNNGNPVYGTCMASTPTLYMVISGQRALYKVDEKSGMVTKVGDFGVRGPSPGGLTAIDNNLYMIGRSGNALYKVDKMTGVAERVMNAPDNFGITRPNFHPQGLAAQGNALYMTSGFWDSFFSVYFSSTFYTVNKDTGEATQKGTKGPRYSTCTATPACDCSQNSDATKRGGTCNVDNNDDPVYGTCTTTPTCDCSQNPDATKRGGTCNVDNNGDDNYDTCRTLPCDCSQNSDATQRNGSCSNTDQLGVNENYSSGLAFIGNTLYMVGSSTDALYTINTDTGMAERVDSSVRGFGKSIYQPRGLTEFKDDLYMISETHLYTLDKDTGVAGVGKQLKIGPQEFPVSKARGLAVIYEPPSTASASQSSISAFSHKAEELDDNEKLIRKLYKDRISVEDISRMTGVNVEKVERIVNVH